MKGGKKDAKKETKPWLDSEGNRLIPKHKRSGRFTSIRKALEDLDNYDWVLQNTGAKKKKPVKD